MSDYFKVFVACSSCRKPLGSQKVLRAWSPEQREECRFFTVPACCVAEVLEQLLRSISAGPGEPATGAREILGGFEQQIENYEEPLLPVTLGREDRVATR